MQQSDNDWIEIRQCTLPAAEVKTIYAALHIKEEPCRRRKFVWHPERPPENMAADLQAVDTGLLEMWGKAATVCYILKAVATCRLAAAKQLPVHVPKLHPAYAGIFFSDVTDVL
jgi:hypothetical protein